MKFGDLSIRLKLVALLGVSAAMALVVSAILTLVLTFFSVRDESLRHLRQTSDIARDNLTATLAFRDNASATRMLGSLASNPRILAAVIADEESKQFSIYVSPAASPSDVTRYLAEVAALARERQADLSMQQGFSAIHFGYMFAVSPIVFDGRTIGNLTLLSDNVALRERINAVVLMQVLVSVLTLVIIAFISIRLQRVFTTPIFHIIETIRTIAQTKNYAVSVDTIQNDEFKVLYTHFNDMIAEIRERDTRLNHLATTDSLTGLANRRHAMDVMQTMVTRARRKQEPFGLVMLDIDHFKRINDQYGHPVGDLVLKAVATTLSRAAREIDLVARTGGEEFLVLCDNSDVEATHQIAERMRAAIEQAEVSGENAMPLKVTVSAGVHASVPESEDFALSLALVDAALYQAKQNGRNRVVNWEE